MTACIAHESALVERTAHTTLVAFIAALLFSCTPVRAQNSVEPPAWQIAAGGKMEFEVASIKLADPDHRAQQNIGLNIDDEAGPPGGRFLAQGTLSNYILFAYKLMLAPEQSRAMVAHLPKWVTEQQFVIEAKAPTANSTKDQMRLMMQSLLADRFKLAVHFESQDQPVLALLLIKPDTLGPRLRPHGQGLACDAKWISPPDRAAPSVPPGEFLQTCGGVGAINGPNHTVLLGARNIAMEHIALYLPVTYRLGRPVIDQTGLAGTFDFTLQWTPDQNGPLSFLSGTSDDLEGSPFLDALKDQLGLKLKPAHAVVQTLVIGHVEQPSPN